MAPMKWGYARVSTNSQDADGQVARLEAAGCDKIFTDAGESGSKASRPEWDRLTGPAGPMRAGDVLVFTKLDRIGRSVKHLMQIAEDFSARGIDMQALDQPIDTTTAAGKLFFAILAAFAEFERNLISERTKDALAILSARGVKGGRARKFTPEQEAEIRRLYGLAVDGRRLYSVRQLAAMFGVSKWTIQATLDDGFRARQGQPRRPGSAGGKAAR